MFTFGSPFIWFLQHELLGGEAACVRESQPFENTWSCSTFLQLIVSFFIYFLAGNFTLVFFAVTEKWLSIKKSSLILITVSIAFGAYSASQLHERYDFLKSIQYGFIDLVFPYLFFLLIIYILHRFIAEEKYA